MSSHPRPAHELAVGARTFERPLGRCVACFRVVTGGEIASWLDGELYHRECARWRSDLYHGQRPGAPKTGDSE